MSTASQEALRAFRAKELRDWKGIPSETTLSDLASVCEVDFSWRASAWIGESHRHAEWLNAVCDTFESAIRVWVDPGQDRILLMDTEDPVLDVDVAALARNMGITAKLDSFLGTFLLEQSEWVCASRGITLYVNPETHQLLRMAVYSPTTLEEYRQNLRIDLRRVRLPLHGAGPAR